jgi:hypothetical protein
MMTLNAAEDQVLLPNYNLEDIRSYLVKNNRASDEVYVKTVYLAHLCSKGDIETIQTFLDETNPEERVVILNECLYDKHEDTCLHIVTSWNTGDKAIELVRLLLEYGADFHESVYTQSPWEHV